MSDDPRWGDDPRQRDDDSRERDPADPRDAFLDKTCPADWNARSSATETASTTSAALNPAR